MPDEPSPLPAGSPRAVADASPPVVPRVTSMRAWVVKARDDVVGGLVSAAVAIPLAMGYGMFAFVALGSEYFAHGVLAGLYTAIIVGVVSVATGDRTTTVYAPRVVTTFFLGALVFALAHSDAPIIRAGNVDHTLAIVFAIILVGGAFQALFGLARLGTLIKHTPQPVMAGFQNAAALLLFLVQLGNVLGYETHTRLAQVVPNLGSAKPLSVAVARLKCVSDRLVPRLARSSSTVPLPRVMSFGRMRRKLPENSTFPCALTGACFRSAIAWFAGSRGSIA